VSTPAADPKIIEFTAKMGAIHPELLKPVTWLGFIEIARRCQIVVRVLPLSHPARLLRAGGYVSIQIKRGLDRTLQTRYGMHEMWHFWNDDIRESCIYADDETVRHPREDAADLFAWYVTSPARIFLEPRAASKGLLTKGSQLTPDLSTITVDGGGGFALGAVGESFHQTEFEQICGPKSQDGFDLVVDAQLICENDNRYDPKAVRVEVQGHQLGYLSRLDARLHRQRFGRRTVICKARIVGGWDRGCGDSGHFGVRLDI
jgi:hypothetical protein